MRSNGAEPYLIACGVHVAELDSRLCAERRSSIPRPRVEQTAARRGSMQWRTCGSARQTDGQTTYYSPSELGTSFLRPTRIMVYDRNCGPAVGRLTDFLNRTIYTTPRIPPCRGAHGESGAHMPRTQRRRVRVKYVAKRHIFFSAQPTHRHRHAIAARGIAGQHVGGRG